MTDMISQIDCFEPSIDPTICLGLFDRLLIIPENGSTLIIAVKQLPTRQQYYCQSINSKPNDNQIESAIKSMLTTLTSSTQYRIPSTGQMKLEVKEMFNYLVEKLKSGLQMLQP